MQIIISVFICWLSAASPLSSSWEKVQQTNSLVSGIDLIAIFKVWAESRDHGPGHTFQGSNPEMSSQEEEGMEEMVSHLSVTETSHDKGGSS